MRLGSLDSSDVSYVAGSVPRAFTEGGRPKRTQDQVAYGRADTPYVPRQAHGAVPESSWPPPFTPMRGLKGARAPRDDRSYLISRAPEPGITDFWWQLGFFRTIVLTTAVACLAAGSVMAVARMSHGSLHDAWLSANAQVALPAHPPVALHESLVVLVLVEILTANRRYTQPERQLCTCRLCSSRGTGRIAWAIGLGRARRPPRWIWSNSTIGSSRCDELQRVNHIFPSALRLSSSLFRLYSLIPRFIAPNLRVHRHPLTPSLYACTLC